MSNVNVCLQRQTCIFQKSYVLIKTIDFCSFKVLKSSFFTHVLENSNYIFSTANIYTAQKHLKLIQTWNRSSNNGSSALVRTRSSSPDTRWSLPGAPFDKVLVNCRTSAAVLAPSNLQNNSANKKSDIPQ